MDKIKTKETKISNNINICYAPDDNYAIPCAVSIQSLLKNVNSNRKITILILDGGLKKENKNLVKEVVCQYKNAETIFIKVNDEDFAQFYTEAWKTTATYRFEMGTLLNNYSKVLYLDCDVIINKPIEELYDIDLKNNILGLVPDIWYKKQNKRFPKKKQPYFNTGVCLFNLDLFRKEKIHEKLISYYMDNRDNIIYPDQDPINAVLDGKILELDYKYNWCWHWEKNEYFEDNKYVNMHDAVIIHYIFNKPWWTTNIHIASNLYFKTIKTLPKKLQKIFLKHKNNKIISYRKFYLLGFIPIFKIINYYTKEYWSIFNIPFIKINRNRNTCRYYLFNFIPFFKIKQQNTLEKHLPLVKALGKFNCD